MPGKDAECKAAALISGVDAMGNSYLRVRKLELRNFISYGFFVDNAREFVVEDNYIHHCGAGLWGGNTTGSMIRRNTVTDITGVALGFSGERGLIVEGNLVQRAHQNPYKVVAWDGSALICNGAMGLVMRNNVVMGSSDISRVLVGLRRRGRDDLRQHDRRLRVLHRDARLRHDPSLEHRGRQRRRHRVRGIPATLPLKTTSSETTAA